jgi:type II secretory pathway pseudopilin PulG
MSRQTSPPPGPLRAQRGFTYVEVLIALMLTLVVALPVLQVSAGAQRLARSQAEATDLHQRARVVSEKLQRDLTMAGAGPLHSSTIGRLKNFLPPVVPARTGLRMSDPELSAYGDRLTILFVPDAGWQAPLTVGMPNAASGIVVDPAQPGCQPAGLCGFTPGSRALILDSTGSGAGYDLFTVTGIAGELAHDAPNAPFSRAYGATAAVVLPIVQRVYYFDRPGRRLMVYDGYQSDVPLADNVVDVRFSYFAQAEPNPGLRPLPLAQLTDGPVLGLSPNRFDADLQTIRLVRVTLRLQAAADEVRGTGSWFARPGRSTSGYSLIPDFEVTFDVAPRNLGGIPEIP